MFSLFLVVDICTFFAFSYGFCGGNLVASLGISDHDGQDGDNIGTVMRLTTAGGYG